MLVFAVVVVGLSVDASVVVMVVVLVVVVFVVDSDVANVDSALPRRSSPDPTTSSSLVVVSRVVVEKVVSGCDGGGHLPHNTGQSRCRVGIATHNSASKPKHNLSSRPPSVHLGLTWVVVADGEVAVDVVIPSVVEVLEASAADVTLVVVPEEDVGACVMGLPWGIVGFGVAAVEIVTVVSVPSVASVIVVVTFGFVDFGDKVLQFSMPNMSKSWQQSSLCEQNMSQKQATDPECECPSGYVTAPPHDSARADTPTALTLQEYAGPRLRHADPEPKQSSSLSRSVLKPDPLLAEPECTSGVDVAAASEVPVLATVLDTRVLLQRSNPVGHTPSPPKNTVQTRESVVSLQGPLP